MDALSPHRPPAPETWVLDTNVWLDWLLFEDPAIEPIGVAALTDRIVLVTDDECAGEFVRVLGYPFGRHTPDESRRASVAARFCTVARHFAGAPESSATLPACRDPDDQKFLTLALRSKATLLVTRDKALLEIARPSRRPLPFRIVAPAAACALLPPPSAAGPDSQETDVPAGSRDPLASCQVRS